MQKIIKGSIKGFCDARNMERFKGAGCPDRDKLNQNTKLQERGRVQNESAEREQAQRLWDALEWQVRYLSLPYDRQDAERLNGGEIATKAGEGFALENELFFYGTPREKKMIQLYEASRNKRVIDEKGHYFPDRRNLSLEEFKQLRSKIDQLSDEELADELKKQNEENSRKFVKFLNREDRSDQL